jgi:hypothetical protein
VTDIPRDFETLCDKEFKLERREAFENLDPKIVAISGKQAVMEHPDEFEVFSNRTVFDITATE